MYPSVRGKKARVKRDFVPWSKRMRIGGSQRMASGWRGVEAAGGKVKHGNNLFTGKR